MTHRAAEHEKNLQTLNFFSVYIFQLSTNTNINYSTKYKMDDMILGQYTPPTVLCCNCGSAMDGTKGLTMCYDCIKLSTDITKEIPREAHINFCRNCERFLMPPNKWIHAQPESRELLSLLLHRLRGINKVRLVDAKFIWTEPHSRRIKIELAVQGEAQPGVIVQQNFGVDFTVIATQCADCARSWTVHTWTAALQIRQKVPHKKTFFHLEQVILKNKAHADTVSIKESRDGIDFFYLHKNHAQRMVDFLKAVVPLTYHESKELISQDTHTGSDTYKFTYSAEIVPICRDDLVCLPKRVANKMGNISQVVLCNKISNKVQFIDPNTLQIGDIDADSYWKEPFPSLANSQQLVSFIVLDTEPLGPSRGKYALADCTVCRENDMNQSYIIRTHLGGILHPGDYVLGYFPKHANYNNVNWDSIAEHNLPDVVLVKKYYPKRAKPKNRVWKLKRMANEHNNVEQEELDKKEQSKVDRDFEMFMQEIEEDDELQGAFELYKNKNKPVKEVDAMDESSEDEEEGPHVDVDQLLDDMESMNLNEQ